MGARGTLMLSPRLRLDTAAMAATGVAAMDTTARGLLMLSLRLMLLLRPAMAMVATVVVMEDTTARGLLMLSLRLRLSPATAMVATAVDMAAMAMVATVVVMEAMAVDTDTARGLLSPAMATGATVVMAAMAMAAGTMVSYHRIRRSELSQKQNHKNS